tara:strand:+ start:906 stop:1091 length:186 start_codon:yes stop_codon:yes gene_type:complete
MLATNSLHLNLIDGYEKRIFLVNSKIGFNKGWFVGSFVQIRFTAPVASFGTMSHSGNMPTG